jgi:hypothetical protein
VAPFATPVVVPGRPRLRRIRRRVIFVLIEISSITIIKENTMRKLVLLVGVVAVSLIAVGSAGAQSGIIPSWQSESGKFGFTPVSNEVSVFRNIDQSRTDRGATLQLVLINSLTLFTEFTFEFTADYNWDYTAGLDHDHYVELSLVKQVTPFVSVNYQQVLSTFEPVSIHQIGLRFVF